jgi:hypothetical protein
MNLFNYLNPKSMLGALNTGDIIILSIVAALFVAIIIAGTIRIIKKRKVQAEIASREADDVVIKKGVRYTDDMTIVDQEGYTNISFGKGDVVLKQNQTYIAERKGYVMPGKYTVLATKEGEEKFNIRIGVYVKEYSHAQEIVLTEGEEITPVSTDIILR